MAGFYILSYWDETRSALVLVKRDRHHKIDETYVSGLLQRHGIAGTVESVCVPMQIPLREGLVDETQFETGIVVFKEQRTCQEYIEKFPDSAKELGWVRGSGWERGRRASGGGTSSGGGASAASHGTCPLCTHAPQQPQPLPCGHTFCRGCIMPELLRAGPVCPRCGHVFGIKRHKAENPWTPSHKQPKNAEPMSPEKLECQEVFRTVKAMLNKLTPTNFDRLVGGIMKANINSERKLKGAIDLIFEKAIYEPAYMETYGKLANAMTALKVPSAANPAEEVLFRNLLLNRCQREFEKDKTDPEDMERRQNEIDLAPEEDKKRLREEMDLKALKDRRRSLGNIRFIGELFKLKMLTDKIMHDCITRMLKTREQENIECLVKLLETIGVVLDRLPRNKSRIDQYFTQLKSLQQEKLFESRVRFNILDLCELRERGWVLRDNQKNKGPTTIAAIHNQAQQEEADRQQLVARLQRENQNMGGGQHGGRGGGARRGQQGGAQGGSDDGWITPLSSRGNTNRIDIEKMLNFSKSQKVDANSVQNLGFTLGQTEPKSPDGKHLSPEKIQRELDRLVITEGAENMDVIDWIFANVGEAHVKEASNVRAIVTSVCMSSIEDGKRGTTVNTEKLKKRMNLIQRFINHDDKLELQALFAVQALVHKLEHPFGVLRSLFDTLYDEDVISEEAFYAWDASEEEMAGKGVAASSVKQFFIWLQNADEVTEN